MLTPHHMSHVTYHMSCVICHVSYVMCNMSIVTCYMSFIFLTFFWTPWKIENNRKKVDPGPNLLLGIFWFFSKHNSNYAKYNIFWVVKSQFLLSKSSEKCQNSFSGLKPLWGNSLFIKSLHTLYLFPHLDPSTGQHSQLRGGKYLQNFQFNRSCIHF